mmetsp:Transcript_7135/g.15575  ORF Transcript_7135/g.15575 Transcript_7135/m.15575 type:complete len:116 (-) Transcript_7135:149-496(-)
MIPPPVFQEYEASARELYALRGFNGGSANDLLPLRCNVDARVKNEHEQARSIVKAIFFNPDGSLMEEIPHFAYSDETALYYAGTHAPFSQSEVASGIEALQARERQAQASISKVE